MTRPKLKRPPPPLDRSAYLAYFEAFLAPLEASGEMSATRFGYLAVGEPSFLARLRKGVPIRFETLERAVACCEKHAAERVKAAKRLAAAARSGEGGGADGA